MMASLLGMPLELLVAVSVFLPTSDLAALRLTCKQVEKSLYEWFAREFFTKKQFMLTHESLQTFIDISKHVSFSKKLTHVIIGTNTYPDIPLRFKDDVAAARYIQGYEDQKALLGTGVDREMLTEGFQNLANLRTVGIRDFNANKRLRDGENANWSSWGATTVHRETGIELQFASDYSAHMPETAIGFVARVFQNLIYALGKANRTPHEVEVLLRRHALADSALHIPHFLEPTIRPVLRNIKTLLLNVDVTHKSMHTHTNGRTCDLHAGRSLRRFLCCTTQLTHLRLNFQKYQYLNNEEFLQWLSSPLSAPGSQAAAPFEPTPVALPRLKKLDLGQLIVHPQVVLNVIAKFAPTLQDISFWRMSLSSRKPVPSLGSQSNMWADLFDKLATVPQLQLNHLLVGFLGQDHMHLNFKSSDNEDAPLLKSKEYSGHNMGAFLRELVDEALLVLPSGFKDPDEEMEEDEEMAGEDGEDEDDEDEEEDD